MIRSEDAVASSPPEATLLGEEPPRTMRALVLVAPQTVAVIDVDTPRPEPHEVLLRVCAAGLCGTDLELVADPSRFHTTPGSGLGDGLVLGHEFSGRVVRRPDSTHSWADGELVVAFANSGCGTCAACAEGWENLCTARPPIRGIHVDGGASDYVLVPAGALVSAGGLAAVVAAGMADAGMTAWHAVQRVRPFARAGGYVLVIGIGGVGHLVVQLAAALPGSSVVAVDVAAQRLTQARGLGAVHAFLAEDAWDGVGGLGAGAIDAVIDLVGSSSSMELAARTVRPGGMVAVVGTAPGTLPFGYGQVPREVSFTVLSGGTRDDLESVILAAERADVHLNADVWPLSAAADALAALREGRVQGRVVVEPGR